MTDPRRDRWSRPITDPSNVIYVDWEGTKAEPACLLGVLDRVGGAWRLRQFAFDPPLRLAGTATGDAIADRAVADVVGSVFERSDRLGATVVSWTEHDRRVLEDVAGSLPLRYRNAKRAIERRRHRAGLEFAGDLQWHLDRVGFERRPEIVSGAAGWITTIRQRTRAHHLWEDVTDKTKEAWALLLEHNATDLWGLQAVVEDEFGAGSP